MRSCIPHHLLFRYVVAGHLDSRVCANSVFPGTNATCAIPLRTIHTKGGGRLCCHLSPHQSKETAKTLAILTFLLSLLSPLFLLRGPKKLLANLWSLPNHHHPCLAVTPSHVPRLWLQAKNTQRPLTARIGNVFVGHGVRPAV